MNITPVLIEKPKCVYNIQNNNNNRADNVRTYAREKDIQNHTLSEAAGRSQVSFKGQNEIHGIIFEHNCSEHFGARKENIRYNREDGSFVHTIRNKKGELEQREEYHPQQGIEIITKVNSKGIKTITKSIWGKEQERTKFDSLGRKIFSFAADDEGNTKSVEIDYERHRQVTATQQYGNKEVHVVDMKTNEEVTSGPLVYDKRYSRNNQICTKINIITGIVEFKTRYDDSGEIIYDEEFSPIDGRLTKSIQYDPYIETRYYENGRPEYVCKIKKGRSNDIKEVYEYEHETGKEKSHTEYIYDKAGNLESKITYIPNSDAFKECTDYLKDNRYIVYKYKKYMDIPASSKTYDKSGKLLETANYNSSGEITDKTLYNSDETSLRIFFTSSNTKSKEILYDKDNNVLLEKKYNIFNGNIEQTVKYRGSECEVTKYSYNTDNEITGIKVSLYSSGQLKEETLMQKDGRTPKIKRVYGVGGRYTEIYYDEYGCEKERKEYSPASHQGPKQTQPEYAVSEDDFLKNMCAIIARNEYKREVSRSDWNRLAKILGLNSSSELFSMDKSTYRKLALKYHSDTSNDKNAERNDRLFKIINNLHN